MRNLFLCLVLLRSLAAIAQTDTAFSWEDFGPLNSKRLSAIGEPFGAFSATGESSLTPQSFRGKTVFVNFWFEACAPCITEIDGLNTLYRQTKDSAGFLFVSFTYESVDKIKALQKKYGIQYPVYHLQREDCLRLNRGLGFPTNILVDKEGKINYLTFGGVNDKKKAEAFLQREFHTKILALLQ